VFSFKAADFPASNTISLSHWSGTYKLIIAFETSPVFCTGSYVSYLAVLSLSF
jgi:hypothetical protein